MKNTKEENEPLGCVHGRGVGIPCPHCLGVNQPQEEGTFAEELYDLAQKSGKKVVMRVNPKEENWETAFDELYYGRQIRFPHSNDERELIKSFIRRTISQEKEKQIQDCHKHQDELEKRYEENLATQKKEIVEVVERLRLECDVVVCDCGEPYKDSDLSDLIDDLLTILSTGK